ncbi:MAG: glycosyltransferase [Candidatus Margulisiibacteriota bacterium]
MGENPKISIITPSRNTGKYLKETVDSILKQTFTNWEHIVVDSCSTDETIAILREYPHIRWISEKDNSPDEAFRKGLAMAKGEYVMLCCVSDGFINKSWLKMCADILDNNPEISLVWGLDQNMLEDGSLDKIIYNAWFDNPPPSGKEFIYYWLKHETLFHERNMCVRKTVMDECFPSFNQNMIGRQSGFMEFFYFFNALGYLPHFIPTVAAYARCHADALSKKQSNNQEMDRFFQSYIGKLNMFKRSVVIGRNRHRYRDGFGNVLPDGFDRLKYLLQFDMHDMKKIAISFIPKTIKKWAKNLIGKLKVRA